MFTGIVEGKFPLNRIERRSGLHTLNVDLPASLMEGLERGSSVAMDGVCLTVAGIDGCTVSFDVMAETLSLTTLGDLEEGGSVNIERSARAGDEIGGHPISGHVDTRARILRVDTPENNHVIRFAVESRWMRYIFSKGFLSVNGCSLTVVNADREAGEFEIWLIPETLKLTTFGEKSPGDEVNIEVDRQTQVIVDTVTDLLRQPGFLKDLGVAG